MGEDDCRENGVSRLVVVGAGAAGTLMAARLVRDDATCRVTLVDPTQRPGRGVAYGTTDPAHLLNVRAGRMSALADEPDHFTRWAHSWGHDFDPMAFAPRMVYGDYLEGLLAEAVETRRVTVRRSRAVAIEEKKTQHGTEFRVQTTAGPLTADAVVLALGHAPPVALPWELDHAGEPWCVRDAWAPDAFDCLRACGPLVLVGTGLTAVDAALSLIGGGSARRVIAVSRHGLLPARHLEGPEPVWPTAVPRGSRPLGVRELLRLVRREVATAAEADVDWRAVIDGLRPAVPQLWDRLPPAERRLFLDRVARYWEVHRHRMAPEVADRVDRLRAEGRLEVVRAEPVDAVPDGAGCRVRLVTAGGSRWVHAAAVVNCTGPRADVTRPPSPLVDAMLARGLVRPDPLRLGLDVAADGGLVDRGGRVNPRLFAIGGLRRGRSWESTAIPEIRQQAAEISRRLRRGRSRVTLT